MTVLIDVDLTLVDTLSPWLRWFKARTGVELSPSSYNIEIEMREYMNNEDPLNYWRGKDLYKDLMPYLLASDTISKLAEKNFDPVFVTWSPYPEQILSKEKWLTEHFGKDIPVIHTHHKEFIDADIMIDDNTAMIAKFLNRNPNRVGLKYDTALNQGWSAPYPQKSLTMKGWSSVQEFFTHVYGVQF